MKPPFDNPAAFGRRWPTRSTATRWWRSPAPPERPRTASSRRRSSATSICRATRATIPPSARSCWPRPASPTASGLPEIEYLVSTGLYAKTKEYGEVITAMLQEQGFNVKLTVMEVAAWLDRIYLQEGQHPRGHMCDAGWSTGSPEPDMVLRPIFYSKAALRRPITDPEIDDALMASRATRRIRRSGASHADPHAADVIAAKLPASRCSPRCCSTSTRANLEEHLFLPDRPDGRVQSEVCLMARAARALARVAACRQPTGILHDGISADLPRSPPRPGPRHRPPRLLHDLRPAADDPRRSGRMMLGPMTPGQRRRGDGPGARVCATRSRPVRALSRPVLQGDLGTSFNRAPSGALAWPAAGIR